LHGVHHACVIVDVLSRGNDVRRKFHETSSLCSEFMNEEDTVPEAIFPVKKESTKKNLPIRVAAQSKA
jgi:hypothetical protein